MASPTNEDPTRPSSDDPGATRTPGARKIGNYLLRRMLGEGAMGQVWLARDRLLDRDVALKLLKEEIAADEQRLRDFLTEARATAKLNHPNIVTIFSVSRKDAHTYIVMEYVEAGSLADELREKGSLSWRDATHAIRDAAAGLEAAHAAGLVHRDVKPSNLMRSARGLVKVVDFGLAKSAFSDPAFTHTMPGTILGSPSYMSPEQCRGEPADKRSDLYSLICSYYQLLTGQLPFSGDEITAIMYQHCHERFPDAGTMVSDLPNGVLRILAKGSQKKPEDRYQSATELLADLDALLAAQDAALSFDGAIPVALPPPAKSAKSPLASFFTRKDLAGKLAWAATAVAILGVGLAILAHRPRGEKSARQPIASDQRTPGIENIPATKSAPDEKASASTRPAPPAVISPPVAVDLNAATFTNSLGMSLVRIAPGKFIMGSPGHGSGIFAEAAERRVTLTRPFMMAATVVTQGQWKSLMRVNPSHFQGDDKLPVENVSWNDAVEFCKKLSEKEGRNYRLPTDAEWEYACRAGTTSAYNTGDDAASLKKAAWYAENSEGKTHPVGQKQPNNWGLFDMHGNVWQWCSDYAGDEFPGEVTDPTGPGAGDPSGSRVLRGGSWMANEQTCVSWARGSHLPTYQGPTLGFRVCLDVPLIASAPPAAGSATAIGVNLIKNGGFTEGKETPDGWNFSVGNKGTLTMARDTVDFAAGPASLRISIGQPQTSGAVQQALASFDNPIDGTLVISGFLKTSLDFKGSASVILQRNDDQWGTPTFKTIAKADGEHAWTAFAIPIPLPLQGTRAPVLKIFVEGDRGTVWADEIRVERVPASGSAVASAPEPTFTNALGMKFVRIEAGEFLMGSPEGEPGRDAAEVQHRVGLTNPFFMSSTVVTQAQWKALMGRVPVDQPQGDDLPNVRVSLDDALNFCKKLSEKGDGNYRLPTEAEWEYACRAGTTTAYYTGDGDAALDEAGWYAGNSAMTMHPVAKKKPNAWGLYDMHGNVCQWCSDFSYYQFYRHLPIGVSIDPFAAPPGNNGQLVIRGGSWKLPAWRARSACRGNVAPERHLDDVGFRVCKDIDSLIKNGNFAQGKETPSDWAITWNKPDTGATMIRDMNDFKAGPASLCLISPKVTRDFQVGQHFDAPATGLLRVSGFVKTSPDFKGVATIAIRRMTGDENSTWKTAVSAQDKHDWQWFSTDFVLPLAGMNTPFIAAYLKDGEGKFWVDELRVDYVPPAVAPAVANNQNPKPDTGAGAFTNSLGMKFARIEPGSFIMGSPPNEPERSHDENQHKVTLTKPFFMGIHPVTRGQFAAFVKETALQTLAEKQGFSYSVRPDGAIQKIDGACWKNPGFDQGDDHPVLCVDWNEAQAFCIWLSNKEGKTYRLPTEAEWEYACRAGTATAYFWGDRPDDGNGFANATDLTCQEKFPTRNFNAFNWHDGFVFSSPVGSFKPNAWGLYDMAGNAGEWCSDEYGAYDPGDAVDPRRESGEDTKVWRGSSFSTDKGGIQQCRAANRRAGSKYHHGYDIGFRICTDAPAAIAAGQSKVIDLLPLVDVNADAIRGKWTAAPGEIKNDGTTWASNLRLPYKTPDEYDFQIEFTCQDPIDSVAQLLSHGSTRFVWQPAGYKNSVSGFGLYRDKKLNENETTLRASPRITAGLRHLSLVQIRKDSVTAFLDGKLISQIKTDYSDLSPWENYDVGERGLGIGANSPTTFTKIQVTEITGQGILTRPGIPIPPATAPASVVAVKPEAIKLIANSLGMKFVPIEPGEFTMGSPASEHGRDKDETPHRVKLTKPFYMAATVVTQYQWKTLMGTNPSSHLGDDLPVERVNWDGAEAFCVKLSQREHKKYRLPTEAEWEYACRAGTTTAYNTGDGATALRDAGWYNGNSDAKSHVPGEKEANAWGLFDMHGNVWQWCEDYYDEYKAGDAVDPTGPREGDKDGSRVARGGSWRADGSDCRSARRYPKPHVFSGDSWGFRVCLDIAAAPALAISPSKNLLKNGSFSDGKTNPDNWAVLKAKGVTIARDTADYFDAPASLRVSLDQERSSAHLFEPFDVPSDGVLRLSGYLKTSADFKGTATVTLQRSNIRLGAGTLLHLASGQDKHDWDSSYFLKDVSLPLAGDAKAEIQIIVEGDRGAAWADGLRIEHVPSALHGLPNKPGREPVHTIPMDALAPGGIWRMEFLPDGRLLCGVRQTHSAIVIDPVTDEEIYSFPDRGKGWEWSREAGVLACGGVMYRLADGKAINKIPDPLGTYVAVTPDGLQVVIRADDDAMSLFDLRAQTRTALFPAVKGAKGTLSDDGNVFLWQGDGILKIYKGDLSKVDAQKPAATYSHDGFNKFSARMRSDGAEVFLTSEQENNSSALFWDWRAGTEKHLFDGKNHANAPALSPDGKFAFVNDWGAARIFDVSTFKPVYSFSGLKSLDSGAFSPDSRRAVLRYNGNQFRIIDLATRKPLFVDPEPCQDRYDPYIAFSRDGRFMATSTFTLASDHAPRTIQIWRLPDPPSARK